MLVDEQRGHVQHSNLSSLLETGCIRWVLDLTGTGSGLTFMYPCEMWGDFFQSKSGSSHWVWIFLKRQPRPLSWTQSLHPIHHSSSLYHPLKSIEHKKFWGDESDLILICGQGKHSRETAVLASGFLRSSDGNAAEATRGVLLGKRY